MTLNEAATVIMEHFAIIVGFGKHIKLKKQKIRIDKEQNKKDQTTGGYTSTLGGGRKSQFNKESLAPPQSTLSFAEILHSGRVIVKGISPS